MRIQLTPRDCASSRLTTAIFVLAFVVVAIVVLWVLRDLSYRGRSHARLEQVTGEIVQAELPAGLRYSYTVNGEVYDSSRARWIPASARRRVPLTESPSMAVEFANSRGLQIGQKVPVFFDPHHPENSCLDQEHPAIGLLALGYSSWLVAAVCIGLASWILIERVRLERLAELQTSSS